MQLKITKATADVLAEWAAQRGIPISTLASELLSESCTHFLNGKIASLRDMGAELGKDQ